MQKDKDFDGDIPPSLFGGFNIPDAIRRLFGGVRTVVAPHVQTRKKVKDGTKKVYNFKKVKTHRKMAAKSNQINRQRISGWKH